MHKAKELLLHLPRCDRDTTALLGGLPLLGMHTADQLNNTQMCVIYPRINDMILRRACNRTLNRNIANEK